MAKEKSLHLATFSANPQEPGKTLVVRCSQHEVESPLAEYTGAWTCRWSGALSQFLNDHQWCSLEVRRVGAERK